MFTGRPNPEWTIDGETAATLAAELERLTDVTVRRSERWRLGYKGFVLTAIDNGVVLRHASVFDGLVEEAARSTLGRLDRAPFRAQADANRDLEQLIYASAPGGVLQDLGDMTFAQLTAPGNETLISGVRHGGKIRQACRSGPDPSRESKWEALDAQNNCYRYANDALNDTNIFAPVAMPGALQMMPPATDTPTVKQLFHQELVNDGLVHCAGDRVPDSCPPAGHLYLCVFLRHHDFTGDVTDYHCLRRDLDGTWSHLDGPLVRHDDDTLSPITDLATAAFWHNPVLVGIYVAPLNNTKIA
jgi:hypothetical protein